MKTVARATALAIAVVSLTLGTASAEGTSAAREPLKVGLVTNAASLGDRSAGHLIYMGLERATRELNVAGRVLTPGPRESLSSSLAFLARQRFDLVIAGFVGDPDPVDDVAGRFPRVRFVTPDTPWEALKHRPRNVRGLLFREEQIGYLAGLMEMRRSGTDVVSSVLRDRAPAV